MTSSNQFEVTQRSARIGQLSVGKLSLDSDWLPYTPTLGTGAFGTTTTNSWRYRVVGRTLTVKGNVVQTAAGTVGSGTYTISLPTGCTIQGFGTHGVCLVVGSTNQYTGVVNSTSGSPTVVQLVLTDPASAAVFITWASGAVANIILSAAQLNVSVTFEVELTPTSAILQR